MGYQDDRFHAQRLEVLLSQIKQSVDLASPSTPLTRTTTTRAVDYTIPAGFTVATVTWLGGGAGNIIIDGIPYSAVTAGSVEFSRAESGSDVVIVAGGNTYYTTVVA